MKRKMTLTLLTLSLLCGFALWHQTRAVAASGHSGSTQVVAWGYDGNGQSTVPTNLSDVTAIAGGGFHSLALKSDGTVVAWGDNQYGQTNVPSGLSGVTAISAGEYHSLALKSDGTVVAWGRNNNGQSTVPTNLSGVTAIAASQLHSLALKSDGTVVAWGTGFFGLFTPPAGLSGVTAIAAHGFNNLALKSDGTVVAWGLSFPVPAGLSGVTAISVGESHSLALKSDGTVVAWGYSDYGETDVPANLSGVVAIAAGYDHNLALKSDGTVVAWGWNGEGETDVPANLSGVMAIAAGNAHSLALRVVNNTAPTISGATLTRTAGSPVSNAQIATVNDAEDAKNTLSVTVTPASGSGVTVSGISVNASGAVTANVAAGCAATTSTFTLQVTDSGNLFAEATLTVTVTPETTPPVISCPGSLVVYLPLNSTATSKVVNYPAPTATDNCTASPTVTTSYGSGALFPLGTTTVNVTAKDAANNQASCSFTVTVLYNFSGFFQPVDNLPTVNAVVAGQAIPVKFSLSGNKGLNIFAAGYPLSQQIACTGGTTDDIEETVTAGASSLSYDATTDRYNYVWKTDKAWKGTCRKLILKFSDGSTREALFQFK